MQDFYINAAEVIQPVMLSPTNPNFISNEVNGQQLHDLTQLESQPQPQQDQDQDIDVEMVPNLEPTTVDNQQPVIDLVDDEQNKEQEQGIPSPKLKSNKKRKYEEMEAEQVQESVGDVIHDTPLSPKRLKLDPSQSTLARLSQVQMFSDITFNVRGVAFYGIKAMFAIKSEKLQELMYPNDGKMINNLFIDDMSAVAFRFIKDFVYDLKPELDVFNIIDVLQASKLYKIPIITEQCNEFLNGINKIDDFLNVLIPFGENSENQEMQDIMNNILENNVGLLQENGEEIIKSEIFQSLPFKIAKRIIESDDLGVKEEEIFNVVTNKWDSNEFGAEIKQIFRFNQMELQFLYDTVKPTGILNDADFVQIYEHKMGLIQELNGFNCNQRFEPKPKSTRKAKGGSTKKKATPTKKKGATKKKTASKKKKTTTKKKGKKSKK